MGKFTAEEARVINAKALATLAVSRANLSRLRTEGTQRRDDGGDICKTRENARVDAPVPEPASEVLAPESDTEGGIFNVIENLLAEVVARFQRDFKMVLIKTDSELKPLT